ncbi:MAG TPA: HD domain-containing phosphohydrolase [Acidimicrobiales bacterium]|nr:HD domain-containing phosphohydrolase [Acidimicrobiales bacterium]
MGATGDGRGVRLAELVAALSLGIDLGFGQPMEHVVRQTWIALRLAERLGLDAEQRSVVYYSSLLTNVGCHTDAHEQAKWFGDDIGLKGDKYLYGLRGPRSAAAGLRRLGAGHPVLHRFRIGLNFALAGHRDLNGMVARHSAMAQSLAAELGLPLAVQEAVAAAYEQWDGKGWPGKVKAEAIPIAARVSHFAEYTEVAHRSGGVDAAVDLARKLAGSQFDPNIASRFVADAADIVGDLHGASAWDGVIAAEPTLTRPLSADELDEALGAVADFVDLKSPYLLGHSRAVAQLVQGAASILGLDGEAARLPYLAALAHGLGRLGVSNAIWDKCGLLGAGEWERVRLQPYLTERMLQQSPALKPIGALAGQLRERVDGSGYPKGLDGRALAMAARVLAAADVYQAMLEPRPHRAARSPDDAAAELRAEARSGRLDGDAAEAVLVAAGHRTSARRERPAGLTAREVEILRLVARGVSSKDIAAELVISPKTARNHIEHIYAKTGVTNRVAASAFASKHGLLGASPA